MNRLALALIALVLVGVGVAGALALRHRNHAMAVAVGDGSRGAQPDPEPVVEPGHVAYWTCSMHPSVKQSQPGTCPICKMDLVPVLGSEVSGGVVTIDEGRRQVIGVKLGRVERRELTRALRASAIVAVDETTLTDVTVRVGGWVRTLAAHSLGKHVSAGDELFTLDSPELIAAQNEYLLAFTADRDSSRARAATSRLTRLGMADASIAALEHAGTPLDPVPVVSPSTGIILEKAVVVGARVEPGMRALRLVDLSSVWVEAAIHEQDLGLVTPGQRVTIELPTPGAGSLEAKVSFVYPYIDDATRTGRLRVVATNADGALKPGMYATCVISLPLGPRLAVPEDAVVYAGEHHVVFRDLGGGKFKPVEVGIGARTQGMIEIASGLAEGDAIAISGVFLLASESRIKSGMSQW